MSWPVAVEAALSLDYLRSCARKVVRDPQLAEDLLHDAIEIAIRKGATADDRDHACRWIVQTVRYKLAHHARDAKIRRTRERHFVTFELREALEQRASLRSDDVAPAALTSAVCALPPRQRAIALMRMGGMRNREIAGALGIAENLAPEIAAPIIVSKSEKVATIIDLRLRGETMREISRVTGLSRSSVSAYISQARQAGAPIPYVRADKCEGKP